MRVLGACALRVCVVVCMCVGLSVYAGAGACAYAISQYNSEESLNKLFKDYPVPDPDNLRGGPSHGGHNTPFVKKKKTSESGKKQVLSYASEQTYMPKCITLALLLVSGGNSVVFVSPINNLCIHSID